MGLRYTASEAAGLPKESRGAPEHRRQLSPSREREEGRGASLPRACLKHRKGIPRPCRQNRRRNRDPSGSATQGRRKRGGRWNLAKRPGAFEEGPTGRSIRIRPSGHWTCAYRTGARSSSYRCTPPLYRWRASSGSITIRLPAANDPSPLHALSPPGGYPLAQPRDEKATTRLAGDYAARCAPARDLPPGS